MKGKFWGNIGLSVVILGLVSFTVTKINASVTGGASIFLPEITVSDTVTQLGDSVALTAASVRVPEKGHMVDASFAIKNSGVHDIKNITVLCTLFDVKGHELGRDKWVAYKTVKATESKTFDFYNKMFISNSVVRSECQIVDLQIAHKVVASGHGSATEHPAGAAEEAGHSSQH